MSLYYGMTPDEQDTQRISMMMTHYHQALEDVEDAPFWQWVAIVDPSTCSECSSLHGKVFRYDDPIWQRYLKRLHKGCRCSFRELTERDLEKKNLVVLSSHPTF